MADVIDLSGDAYRDYYIKRLKDGIPLSLEHEQGLELRYLLRKYLELDHDYITEYSSQEDTLSISKKGYNSYKPVLDLCFNGTTHIDFNPPDDFMGMDEEVIDLMRVLFLSAQFIETYVDLYGPEIDTEGVLRFPK